MTFNFSSVQGAASVKEFYAKNSVWTEGLISASKAVGWGATQLLYVCVCLRACVCVCVCVCVYMRMIYI